MEIISIQGASGVGKTSLLHRIQLESKHLALQHEINEAAIIARNQQKLSLKAETNFIQNQKLFIHHMINQLKKQQKPLILLDRGPEDIEFFSLYYPKIKRWQLNVEQELAQELQELRCYPSKWILYLVASETELRERVSRDKSRKRNSFEENLKLLPYEVEWYSKLPTTFIQTSGKSSEDVFQEVLLLLRRQGIL